jgi:hypothetical protein
MSVKKRLFSEGPDHPRFARCWSAAVLGFLLFWNLPVFAADTFAWRTNENLVSADIKDSDLRAVLEKVASVTGWKVFVEPQTAHKVSTKFKDLPPGEALHLLLGDVNFALIPGTNTASRLFVFRTSMRSATQAVRPGSQRGRIGNELIVRLKPGARIEDLARQLGAKVVGRIAGLNAYRLQFTDQAAADSAHDTLSSNSDVASVDYNYSIDRPPEAGLVPPNLASPMSLQLKPPPDDGKIIIGLVDTELQSLCDNLDSFILKPVSVASDSAAATPAPAPTPAAAPATAPTHATAMAATMLRSLQNATGGKTSVQILPVDVYGANQSTSTFDVANGVISAANGGAKIINLSLGSGGDSPFLHQVIQEVTGKNIAVFAAAGNQPVTSAFYPAAYPEVMAVTAVDQGQLAPYANRGSFVSLGAPGDSVFCYNGQSYMSTGTSVSSSYISGLAAGHMETSNASVSDTEKYIQSTAGIKIVPKQ